MEWGEIPMDADLLGPVDITLNRERTARGYSELTLTPGRIDWQAQEYLGRAYCHYLAGTLASYTGWPVVTIDYQTEDGDWRPAHSGVRTPQGSVLDIFGVNSLSAVLDRYARANNSPVRYRVMRGEDLPTNVMTGADHLHNDHLWWARDLPVPNRAVYQHFARLLLGTYGYAEHLPAGVSAPAPASEPATDESTPDMPPAPTQGPNTETPTPHGGSTAMTSIDEIRHALMTASEKARYAQGALAQASQDVDEIAHLLQQAAGSSSQPAIQEASGTFTRVREELEQLRGLLHTGSEAVEGYAAGL
ncbi:SPOR domain-containing protein [Actinopolyspora mortivallis]|uniref:Uncharacterized protein n=1 Tax=Actinopolyspora mortivallis TaxID=33906 RepID=A0A2T0GSN7_ACTMO|nr:hypothetical protein [Actinopolyspora mortivallis]PRW62126.1 hypothetical protein CEP50_17195 [Actinopolyspora mortivallis]